MTNYKQAGDLVPDDVFIRRRSSGAREIKSSRVIITRPGNAATVVEITRRVNEDRQAQREQFLPEQSRGDGDKGTAKGRGMRPCNYGEAALRRDAPVAERAKWGRGPPR